MILDALEQSARYTPLHPGFAEAFQFLRRPDLATLPDGNHAINGDWLFVIISRDPPRGREAAKLEAHRQYIDIQYVVQGRDEIGWQPTAACRHLETPYDEQRDVMFFSDRPSSWISVAAGALVVFWPEDAHAPLAGRAQLMKAVVKVALDW